MTLLTKDLRALLRSRYLGKNGNGIEWAYVEEVTEHVRGGGRLCDAIAVGLWGSRGHHFVGHEIKVSRSDWHRELAQPEKADPFIRYCHRWWIVAAPGIVQTSELPPKWGLLEPGRGGKLTATVQAPLLKPLAPAMSFVAAVIRRCVEVGLRGDEIEKARAVEAEKHKSKITYLNRLVEQAESQANADAASFRALAEAVGDRWLSHDPQNMAAIGEAAKAAWNGGKTIERVRHDCAAYAAQLRQRADELDAIAKVPA